MASDSIDWFKMAYTILGGLGLFFYGMKSLSESLQAAASDWIQKVVGALTTNRLIAVVVGLVVTCVVQSSSITTVMVVGFVNAGLMNLAQAIGVIFGANIGTTITGWMLTLKVGKYSLFLLGLGIFPYMFAKSEKVKTIGQLIFAVGLVFLGLKYMGDAFKPLRSNEGFISYLSYFTADSYLSLLATALMGCLLTFVIQSSSAMIGITIALASTGAISFQTALALVMGENIGTTITALLAGVGANVSARRASMAHAIFNLAGVLVLSLFFWQYVALLESIIPGLADFTNDDGSRPYIAAHIAAGHSAFNIINVIIFLPLLHYLKRLVIWLIPDPAEKEKKKLVLFGNRSTISPALAIEQARLEVTKMADIVNRALNVSLDFLLHDSTNDKKAKQVGHYETIADDIQTEVMLFLGKVMELNLTSEESTQITTLIRQADELESISDDCFTIVQCTRRFQKNSPMDSVTREELTLLANRCQEIYTIVIAALATGSNLDNKNLDAKIKEFNANVKTMKTFNIESVKEGRCTPLALVTLNDMVSAFRRIKSHTVNLGDAYHGGKHLVNSKHHEAGPAT